MKKKELQKTASTKGPDWHSLPLGDVFAKVESKREGLTAIEAEKRLKQQGRNEISLDGTENWWRILLRQFLSPLISLLVVAGAVAFFLNAHLDAIVIFGAVALNTAIGFFQEKRALSSLQSLRNEQQFYAWVRREGAWQEKPVEELVTGDIIKIKPGDRIPADARLIAAHDLTVVEAVLTGESQPVKKDVSAVPEDTPLGDRSDMVWMGTTAADGRGEAVVVSTGLKTEFGRIHALLSSIEKVDTPFQKKVAKLGRFLSIVVLIVTALILAGGVLAGESFTDMFLVAVAVAVSAIPESLPVAVTVILAIGMAHILKERGLVKHLSATEALGSTSVILTDKTGTLTLGEMRVSQVLTAQKERGALDLSQDKEENTAQSLALQIGALTSEAIVENPREKDPQELRVHGRPTDAALTRAALEAGIQPDDLDKQFKTVGEIPFNSDRKFAGSIRTTKDDETMLFFAGAPEVLLQYITRVQVGERSYTIDKDEIVEFRNTISELANKGLRVILVGYRQIDGEKGWRDDGVKAKRDLLKGATFVGLIGIKDPVRKDVPDMIALTRDAGIRTVVVTGDHALTAQAVAREAGLLHGNKTLFTVMEGSDIEEMEEEDLARQIRTVDIFARVSPAHKVKIAGAWQRQDEVIAMTGDGVNDAPALKRADVGIAVGTGTDIAKETADIVLLDNSFSTIVAAVKEGRVIFDNLKKVIAYLLSGSFSEMVLISFSLLAGMPLPVLPAQILWVNLIEDSLPSIALSFDPPEDDVMSLPPQGTKKPLIDKEIKTLVFIIGVVINIILIGLFVFFLRQEMALERIRTIIFGALAVNSLFYSFSIRSLRRPLWKINFFQNKYLLGAVGIGILSLIASVYLPPLQTLLRTVPLSGLEWIIIVGFGILNIVGIEIGKWLFIHRRADKANPKH